MLTLLLLTSMMPVRAATEEEIEQSIIDGVAWLASQQNEDGSWGTGSDVITAYTCFALIKLQDRAYELEEYDGPFDPDYPYYSNVIEGWDYIFMTDVDDNALNVFKHTLTTQDHTAGASGNIDDPDTNGNEYGLTFGTNPHRNTYSTGVCLMALEASRTPDRGTGIDFDGDTNPDTFLEVAQDAVDWFAFAQGDTGHDEGGWYYTADSTGTPVYSEISLLEDTDNSNGGFAVLGLAAGENFGCNVPEWVKTELDVWIDTLQDDVDGDTFDGGSWYRPEWEWINLLKTGNLLFEMTFYGDDSSAVRFQDALDYIERHWQDAIDPGWGYSQDPADYLAMYTLMKGFEYSGIETIDLSGLGGDAEHDWFEEFSTVIVDQQNIDGSWSGCNWGNPTLCTVWALLTLEKITPPPPVVDVYVDIKPGSCPNPLNTGKKGVIPVAILGTEDFDVTTIDPATIQITMEGLEVGVSPLRWNLEDVATPFEGELCDCHDLDGDGYMDLTLKFEAQEVVNTLTLEDYAGETIPLTINGNLMEEFSGTQFEGQDCMWILEK